MLYEIQVPFLVSTSILPCTEYRREGVLKDPAEAVNLNIDQDNQLLSSI
jgi:hypothetical protein